MSTYTLPGYSYDLDASAALPGVANVAPATLQIMGSANLRLVLEPLATPGLVQLALASGSIDSFALDGEDIDLGGDRFALSVLTYARGGITSQLALLVDGDSTVAGGGVRAWHFTLSGVGLTNVALPSDAQLQQALNTVPTVDPDLGALQPGQPFAVADLPDVVVSAGTGGLVLSGGDGANRLEGGAGDDTIDGAGGRDSILGRDGDDLIAAGPGPDNVAGAAGDDTITGGLGLDTLGGGLGNDVLSGGSGNDALGGGQGDDVVRGGDGNDQVSGGAGNDTLTGDAGNDTMGGSFGNDSVEGNDGNDALGGGAGADTLRGGTGFDSLGGGEGRDLVLGGEGADFIAGGGGADTLRGGDGADTLVGGDGNDLLSGQAGSDLFVFNLPDPGGVDVITDFEDGVDRIRLSGVEGAGAAAKVAALGITDTAEGALIAYQGQTVLFEGVAASDLGTEDFVFV